MQLKRRHAIALLAAAALATVLVVFDLDPSPRFAAHDDEDASPRPTAIIEAPRVTLFNEAGEIRHQLRGEQLTSSGTGRWLEVALPQFDLGTGTGDVWHLRSIRGVYDQQSAVFSMMGEVRAERTAAATPILVSTEFMEIDLDTDQLSTHAAVRIESPAHVMSGIGMVANINLRRFELLQKVEAVHELP